MTTPILPSYFSAVSSPVYSKADNSTIDCTVTISESANTPWAGTTHQYTAASHDPMDYGVELYNYIIAGGAGAIAPYVAPTLTPQQQAATAIAAGIVLTSTAAPTLNGTYPVDPGTQVKLNSAITYIMLNSAFPPALATSMAWYDSSGTPHTFTSLSDFKNFAVAFADFVAHVDIYASSNGASGSIPSNAITIA